MQHADRLDLAQEEELAALEGRSLNSAARRAAAQRRAARADRMLARCAVRRQLGVRVGCDPEPPVSAWHAVERAAMYAPLCCPVCLTGDGGWHTSVPAGATMCDGPEPPGHWELWLGPKRPAQVWVCAAGHATYYPLTARARNA